MEKKNLNFEKLTSFLFLVFVKNSKRYTYNIEFWKRTILMSNIDVKGVLSFGTDMHRLQ